jgi:hypothetical protein
MQFGNPSLRKRNKLLPPSCFSFFHSSKKRCAVFVNKTLLRQCNFVYRENNGCNKQNSLAQVTIKALKSKTIKQLKELLSYDGAVMRYRVFRVHFLHVHSATEGEISNRGINIHLVKFTSIRPAVLRNKKKTICKLCVLLL